MNSLKSRNESLSLIVIVSLAGVVPPLEAAVCFLSTLKYLPPVLRESLIASTTASADLAAVSITNGLPNSCQKGIANSAKASFGVEINIVILSRLPAATSGISNEAEPGFPGRPSVFMILSTMLATTYSPTLLMQTLPSLLTMLSALLIIDSCI